MLVTVFILAVLRYQNPYFPYYQTDFGVDGPYHNFMWDLFGTTERFRGPYISPNILGYNVVCLTIMASLRRTKLRYLLYLIAVTVLLLSGSRISLFALFCFFAISRGRKMRSRIGSEDKTRVNVNSKYGALKNRAKILFGSLGIVLVAFSQFSSDTTLNGRTTGYARVLSNLSQNLVFGTGPTLKSSVNSIESTFVSILSCYGLFGLVALLLIMFGVFVHFRESEKEEREILIPVILAFLVAASGESLLLGGSYDVGLIYLFAIMGTRSSRESVK